MKGAICVIFELKPVDVNNVNSDNNDGFEFVHPKRPNYVERFISLGQITEVRLYSQSRFEDAVNRTDTDLWEEMCSRANIDSWGDRMVNIVQTINGQWFVVHPDDNPTDKGSLFGSQNSERALKKRKNEESE